MTSIGDEPRFRPGGAAYCDMGQRWVVKEVRVTRVSPTGTPRFAEVFVVGSRGTLRMFDERELRTHAEFAADLKLYRDMASAPPDGQS